jgi:hypothetical protein
MLKPNGISHTVYPEKPAKDFNDWMEHNTTRNVQATLDNYEEKFAKLWADFKRDVIRNTSRHA